LLQYTKTLIADANGSTSYQIDEGVPVRSVWFAVDSQTSEYAGGAPGAPGELTVARPLLAQPAAVAGVQETTDVLNIDAELADVLIVRPGGGVWTGSCGRNSMKDINRGKSGTMQLSLNQVASTSTTPGHPDTILSSDLIIVVDAERLLYYVGNIAGH
jgi:hypothetical protein